MLNPYELTDKSIAKTCKLLNTRALPLNNTGLTNRCTIIVAISSQHSMAARHPPLKMPSPGAESQAIPLFHMTYLPNQIRSIDAKYLSNPQELNDL